MPEPDDEPVPLGRKCRRRINSGVKRLSHRTNLSVAVVADLGYRYAKTVLEMNSRILDILFFGCAAETPLQTKSRNEEGTRGLSAPFHVHNSLSLHRFSLPWLAISASGHRFPQ